MDAGQSQDAHAHVQVAEVFDPQQMTVTLSVSASSSSWAQMQGLVPPSYQARGCAMQHLPHGGHVAFYSLQRSTAAQGLAQPQASAPCEAAVGTPRSLTSFSASGALHRVSNACFTSIKQHHLQLHCCPRPQHAFAQALRRCS